MALVNPNDVAAAGCRVLQGAIDKLDALKQLDGCDTAQINALIDASQSHQAALRDQTLQAIEDSDENRQAIMAMNAATASLNAEAANMRATAADLANIAKVVATAGSLVAALAQFT